MTEQFFKELKALRESQKIEISEISDRTKINPVYFEAIEKGDFSLLPVVYMRLFLRSYAIEIGADADKTLRDYELYTTGKVNEKVEIKVKKTAIDETPAETADGGEISQFEMRKKFIWGFVALIALFILIKFIMSLLEEQQTDINPGVTTEQVQPVEENTIPVPEPEEEITDEVVYSPLPPIATLRESNVYSSAKSNGRLNVVLPITAPYSGYVEAKTRTKVHFSTQRSTIVNDILEENERIEFTYTDTLRFDLWSAQHISIVINQVDLSLPQYVSSKDMAVRASIVGDGSLSVEYFLH